MYYIYIILCLVHQIRKHLFTHHLIWKTQIRLLLYLIWKTQIRLEPKKN
nr:MAG TPA: hypothetical protein [Caudoviricetes sp.]